MGETKFLIGISTSFVYYPLYIVKVNIYVPVYS